MRNKIEKVKPTMENILRIGARITKDPLIKYALYRAAEQAAVLGIDPNPWGYRNKNMKGAGDPEAYQCAHIENRRIKMPEIGKDIMIVCNTQYPEKTQWGYRSYRFRIIKPRIILIPHGGWHRGGESVVSYPQLKKYILTTCVKQVDVKEKKYKYNDYYGHPCTASQYNVVRYINDASSIPENMSEDDIIIDMW